MMTTTPPQATQDEPVSETYRLDEGEREKLIALIGQAHKGKTSAFIADAILEGYSRRTETADFLAKYDAGMMAAADETIAFLKQRAGKAEEAREIAKRLIPVARGLAWNDAIASVAEVIEVDLERATRAEELVAEAERFIAKISGNGETEFREKLRALRGQSAARSAEVKR